MRLNIEKIIFALGAALVLALVPVTVAANTFGDSSDLQNPPAYEDMIGVEQADEETEEEEAEEDESGDSRLMLVVGGVALAVAVIGSAIYAFRKPRGIDANAARPSVELNTVETEESDDEA